MVTSGAPAIPRALVDRVIDCVRAAGAAIQDEQVRHGRAATAKADGSPVTACDRAAERVILEHLRALDGAIPIVSEESAVPPYDVRKEWTRFWLVDPLDGTKEFLTGLPDWTVNVALIEGDEPVLGVVLAPARTLLYFGARGIGSFRVEGDGPAERISVRPPEPGRPLRVVESRAHRSEALDRFLSRLPVGERVAVGSSLKLCWVADGHADLYARFTPVMEWDVAAGDCVFRYAATGAPNPSMLRYNTRDLRIPRLIIGFVPPGTEVEDGPTISEPGSGAQRLGPPA